MNTIGCARRASRPMIIDMAARHHHEPVATIADYTPDGWHIVTLVDGSPRAAVVPNARSRESSNRSIGWFLVGACWLASAVAVSASAQHLFAGITLAAVVVVAELLASPDDYGSKALSGMLSLLAILIVGWLPGIVVALGTVVFGDLLLRRQRPRLALWWGMLLAVMLTAASWTVSVRGTVPLGSGPPRAVATVAFVIFAVWASHRLFTGRTIEASVGVVIIGIIGTALAGPSWLPLVPVPAAGWVGAGMTGMRAAAAFMLADMLVASIVVWRVSGQRALAFWPEHMPVLFFRYAGQGILAGLVAYAYAVGGPILLVMLLVPTLGAQWLYRSSRRVDAVLQATMRVLSSAIDARDEYTGGHSSRVADYAARSALRLGWSKAKVERVRKAGLLHDVGKLGVADVVLHKPGRLSPDEFEHIKRHAPIGETIVSQIRELRRIADIVGQHHERWNGGGYPHGLSAEAISLEARLVTIIDVYDAMTTARPYRPALPEDEVLEHIEHEAGRQFDPELAKMFVRMVREGRTAGVAFCYCATH